MRSALPGKSSPNTAVALTKVALRIVRLPELANVISDLTGLGQANIKSLVRTAEKDLASRPSAEFTAVTPADRDMVEDVLVRTYQRLAAHPAHQVMSESLIGTEAVVRLADEAMTTDDRRVVGGVSDDARAYLSAVSESIAYLICQWYSMNEEQNRAAISQATGETLQSVRAIPNQFDALKAHLDSSLASVLVQLEKSMKDPSAPNNSQRGPEPEPIVFEVDLDFAPLATNEKLSELVGTAVVAVLEARPIRIEVSLPTLNEDVKKVNDAVVAAQLKHHYQDKAEQHRLALSAFFSPQVETEWAPYLLGGVSTRMKVVRAILARQETKGAKLDVWRTTPPRASAPIWLTPDEVQAVVESVKLTHWDQLGIGAWWRAADELPRSVIVEKVMSSILTTLVRGKVTSQEDWAADVLFLPSWHIGQG